MLGILSRSHTSFFPFMQQEPLLLPFLTCILRRPETRLNLRQQQYITPSQKKTASKQQQRWHLPQITVFKTLGERGGDFILPIRHRSRSRLRRSSKKRYCNSDAAKELLFRRRYFTDKRVSIVARFTFVDSELSNVFRAVSTDDARPVEILVTDPFPANRRQGLHLCRNSYCALQLHKLKDGINNFAPF